MKDGQRIHGAGARYLQAHNPLLSPEDRQVLIQRRAPRTMAQVAYQIRHGRQMRPWMLAYAEWLLSEPEAPTVSGRRAVANKLAKCRVSKQSLEVLEQRADFLAYYDEISQGPVEEARAKYLRRLPEAVDAYWEALGQARAKQDYQAVAQIVAPAIDRVVPRKQEPIAATQINVVLSAAQLAGFTEDYQPPATEAQVVEPDA